MDLYRARSLCCGDPLADTRAPGAATRYGGRTGVSSAAAQPVAAAPPRRLLWSLGVAAFVLGLCAFVLWGVEGAGTLFDMMAAFCS